MSWLDLVDNTTELEKLYGGETPSLKGIDLNEVRLRRRRRGIALRFDLADFPEYPPERWVREKHNTVQLAVDFFGVIDFSLQGWARHMVVDLCLAEVSGGVRCTVESDVTELHMTTKSARLYRISGYQNEERRCSER